MTTPLKALIQERLRAKIVRQEIDDDSMGGGGDVDDFASLDRELDLQSPSHLLSHQQVRGARRGSVDARPSSVHSRTHHQLSSQEDHLATDAASRRRRHNKHHASNAGHRQRRHHDGHDECRRRHHHNRRNDSRESILGEEQQQQKQLDTSASEKLLDFYAYDHCQQFDGYSHQDRDFGGTDGTRYHDERFTALRREADTEESKHRHVRATSPWERHQDSSKLTQQQQAQADLHQVSLTSSSHAPPLSSYGLLRQHDERRLQEDASGDDPRLQKCESKPRDSRVHAGAEPSTSFLPLPSPRVFSVASDMQGLLGASTLIPAEAYEVGFPSFDAERFDFARVRSEPHARKNRSSGGGGAAHTGKHSEPQHEHREADSVSELEPRKRGFAALNEVHGGDDDADVYERQHRQCLLYRDKNSDTAPDQPHHRSMGHHEYRSNRHDTHDRPPPQRFEHSASLHLDMATNPLAAASSLAPLVFAAATSPRLETKRGSAARRLHQPHSYTLASPSGGLPAPLDMAAVELSESLQYHNEDSESNELISAGRTLSGSGASELLSRRPAGPLVCRLNSKTLSPGCRRAATAFVEKRRRRAANSTPRTMATQRWLQSMDLPPLSSASGNTTPTATTDNNNATTAVITVKSALDQHYRSYCSRTQMPKDEVERSLDASNANPDASYSSSVTL